MRIHLVYATLCLLLILLIPQTSHSCTTFCLDKGNQLVVGFNLNWMTGKGLMIVNKRNVSKTALLNPEVNCPPISWTSKFGSVAFTLSGRDFSVGGMNEAGLVIHLLRTFSSLYPPPDSRHCISQGQWVQYQLDNFDKIEQVIANDSKIRILPPPPTVANLHYFVCDGTGNCTVIECIDGKTVYYTKERMPTKVLSNNRYDECVSSLGNYESWSGDSLVPQGKSSYDRFVRAADMVKKYKPKDTKSTIDYAFSILANVEGVMPIQWSIVYDIKNLCIYYHTIDNKQIRFVDLDFFDFSCKTPVMLLDVNAALSGNITNKFTDYSYEINRDYMNEFCNRLNIPEEVINAFARYPESTVCMEK